MGRYEPVVKNTDSILKVMALWEYCSERVGEMNYNVRGM